MPGITPAPRQRPAATLRSGPRARPRHLESAQQREFVRRWRAEPRLKEYPAFAVPNAGRRSKVTGGILKAEGMEAGAPDWVLLAPERALQLVPAHGLALEFKSPEEVHPKPSPAQVAFRAKLEAQGYRYEIVQTADHAWQLVLQYLNLEEIDNANRR